MNIPELKTGDVAVAGSRSLISRLIKFFTRSRGETATRASHVGVMYDQENICEAVWPCVKIRPLIPQLDECWWAVYRPLDLTDENRACLKRELKSYEGRTYGFWKLLVHALGLQRFLYLDDYPVCSWVCGHTFDRCVGPKYFGLEPNVLQPDDIDDLCLRDDRFEFLYDNELFK